MTINEGGKPEGFAGGADTEVIGPERSPNAGEGPPLAGIHFNFNHWIKG